MRDAFSPVPIAARIPYPALSPAARLVFDAASDEAMGMEQAEARI
jgi:hypothetical protein